MENDPQSEIAAVRAGRPLRRLLALVATALSLAAVFSAAHAPGGPLKPGDHCGQGDVTAIKNAYYPLWSTKWGDPLNAPNLCQFRTFFEPPEGICFCEHDTFVGGDVFSANAAGSYAGLTARQLVDLETEVTTPLDPPGLPMERFVTPVRGWKDPDGVRLVLKHTGVVFRNLPPGSYTISTQFDVPPFPGWADTWVVTFHVLPHDEAHTLGRPTGEFPFGSVKCPAAIG